MTFHSGFKQFEFWPLLIVGGAASMLGACADKSPSDIDFPVIEMTADEEWCVPGSYESQDGLNVSEENLYKLLGRPNKSETINVASESTAGLRIHLIERANAAALRGESLFVTESTWNIGPCRLTVWLWPDAETGAVAFSSTQYHKDVLF